MKTQKLTFSGPIWEESKISKFPWKFQATFRKKCWYMYPQAWLHITTYKNDVIGGVYNIPTQFNFSWLFIDFQWTLRMKRIR